MSCFASKAWKSLLRELQSSGFGVSVKRLAVSALIKFGIAIKEILKKLILLKKSTKLVS